jgi:hypothetical protein
VPKIRLIVYSVLAGCGLTLLARRPRKVRTAPNGPLFPPEKAIEPLDQRVLLRRSLDIFPAGYQTTISIIQGVSLSVLVTRAVDQLQAPQVATVPLLGRAAFTLAGIVLVSYGYLWFTTIMRWASTFRDILVPYLLGVGEIVSASLLNLNDATPTKAGSAWWFSAAGLAFLGAVAYWSTHSRLDTESFGDRTSKITQDAERRIRVLLRRLIGCCLVVFLLCVLLGIASRSKDPTSVVRWLVLYGPWPMMPLTLTLVLLTETALNRLFRTYNLLR